MAHIAFCTLEELLRPQILSIDGVSLTVMPVKAGIQRFLIALIVTAVIAGSPASAGDVS
jgi:riboflavin synthase alpha subunit